MPGLLSLPAKIPVLNSQTCKTATRAISEQLECGLHEWLLTDSSALREVQPNFDLSIMTVQITRKQILRSCVELLLAGYECAG